ncbi:MAG: radical SAM protein [Bryobacterales bacterium]
MSRSQTPSFAAHLARIQWKTALGRRVTPPFVTLYVTTRCDEKCIHCFYWDELNPKPNSDFSLEEFQRVLASMDEIYNLFLGGGEPFLRADLASIVLAAVDTNNVANVYVPTNGQHTARVVETLETTLAAAPGLRFHLNLSVDHVDEEKHDHIRGRENAWRRMLQTADAIAPLRKRFPNLIVHTLTTVMKENQDEILEIYEELRRRFRPDGLSFNYCRGTPLDPSQTEVKIENYEKLLRRMEQDYSEGHPQSNGPNAFGAANHLLDQRVRLTVDRTVAQQRAQFSCVSGRLAGVIYSNGDVVECEIKNSRLGNLRRAGYDFRRLWFGERARRIAREAADGCFCTHECGHYASTIYSVPRVVQIAAGAALRGVIGTRRPGEQPANSAPAPASTEKL